jgi:hypothetical protein
MTIVMKRKQSTGKERKRKERKDKNNNNNNKDKKYTVYKSKSKSTTQKKRRRFTKKQKKAKLMKKRSIRKQRGGNPTELEELADEIGGVMNEEEKRTAALRKLGELGTAAEAEKAETQTKLTSQAADAQKEASQTTSASQTQALETRIDKEKVREQRLVTTRLQELKAEEEEAKRKAEEEEAKREAKRKAKREAEKLFEEQNIETLYNKISGIKFDTVIQINAVIKKLLKSRISKSKAEIYLYNYYIDKITNEHISDNNANSILKDVNAAIKRHTDIIIEIKNNAKSTKYKYSTEYIRIYTLIKQKIELFKNLLEQRKTLKDIEAGEKATKDLERLRAVQAAKKAEQEARKAALKAEEEARKAEQEAAARQKAEQEAEKEKKQAAEKEQNFVTNTVDRIQALKNDADDYFLEISGNIDDLNNYTDASLVYTKDVYEILSLINNKVKDIEKIKTEAETKKNSIIDSKYYTKSVDVSTNSIINDIENTLTSAKTLQVEAIINIFILKGSREEIINGNTPPDTPKEKKISKIAEQKYIVIPDPANNINKDYFCEGGIPAEAKKFKYYIIFLDGYEGTEVTYNNKPIRLTEEKHNIENCLSKI